MKKSEITGQGLDTVGFLGVRITQAILERDS
jgi:hypothetical protein